MQGSIPGSASFGLLVVRATGSAVDAKLSWARRAHAGRQNPRYMLFPGLTSGPSAEERDLAGGQATGTFRSPRRPLVSR